MTSSPAIPTRSRASDYVVAPPRVTDALGLALRGVFDGATTVPEDMAAALARIDCATACH